MNSVTGRWVGHVKTASLILVALILGACGPLSQGKATGEKAVAKFHALYNQGRIEDIWTDADPRFRTSTTKRNYEGLMQAMQRKLGNVLSTSNIIWQVQSYNMKTSVLLSQATTFQRGQGTEAFTFALNGTNVMLVQYSIQSIDMMEK